MKQPTEDTLKTVLNKNRLQEQALLQQRGVTDPLEMEFSAMVAPIMGACTKDSIGVRIVKYMYPVSFDCCVLCVPVGWQGLDLLSLPQSRRESGCGSVHDEEVSHIELSGTLTFSTDLLYCEKACSLTRVLLIQNQRFYDFY